MIDAAFASVGKGELLRFLALFILLVAGWLLSVSLAFRLHFANDTIRMLRANAFAIRPEERQAMERAVAALNGGQQVGPDTPLAGDAATLRGLLERAAKWDTKQPRSGAVRGPDPDSRVWETR